MTIILQSLLKFLYFSPDRQFCFIINLNLIKLLLFLGCRRQFSNCIRKIVKEKCRVILPIVEKVLGKKWFNDRVFWKLNWIVTGRHFVLLLPFCIKYSFINFLDIKICLAHNSRCCRLEFECNRLTICNPSDTSLWPTIWH